MSASATSLAPTQPAIPTSPAASTPTAYPIPGALQEFLQKLETSLLENKRKAIWDGLKFWSLKAPAILAAGGSGITAFVNSEIGLSVAILNGILGICVVLDGMLHPGEHRNVHLRASEAMRNLKDDIESKWQLACCEGHTSTAMLAEILQAGWKERRKIAAFVEGTLFTGMFTGNENAAVAHAPEQV